MDKKRCCLCKHIGYNRPMDTYYCEKTGMVIFNVIAFRECDKAEYKETRDERTDIQL